MSKRTNQLPNYLERAETNVVLIVFNGDLYRVRAYIVVVLTVALHESGKRRLYEVHDEITLKFI